MPLTFPENHPETELAGTRPIAGDPSGRLVSLDVFRGLTIAGMLLVNNPGSWRADAIYPALRHAEWNGCTPTDLVFPFFLFIVGVSLVLSSARRLASSQPATGLYAHVIRRSVALVILGLFQSRFPLVARDAEGFFTAWAKVGFGGVLLRLGLAALVLAAVVLLAGTRRQRAWIWTLASGLAACLTGWLLTSAADAAWFWRHLLDSRIPGVLQRIGICYFLAASLYLRCQRQRVIPAVLVGLLVGSALWMLYIPVPGCGRPDLAAGLPPVGGEMIPPFCNWGLYLDTSLFGARCFLKDVDAVTGQVRWAFDPDGAASTPAALASVLLGILCGSWLQTGRSRRLARMLFVGALLTIAGLLLHGWLPLNKQLWTGSYVLLTGGLALLVLGGCYYGLEIRGWRFGAVPFVAYGQNAILAFLGSSLTATLLIHLRVSTVAGDGGQRLITWKTWLYENLFRTWACPRNASLFFALGVVVVWAGITWWLRRRRIFLKI
ncbi:MAG: DUF5009 domain-containing protein [bacterium]